MMKVLVPKMARDFARSVAVKFYKSLQRGIICK